ncbi:unnamed protein product [Blepharisma stoltei]|uniref:Uncharacterized protein n=1 Tax=Blepharisma stoltei TaxID=1481888 RepID=A0AAU9JC67_9CILI|nr:unnamed protein product [Blepharisma stoltei]
MDLQLLNFRWRLETKSNGLVQCMLQLNKGLILPWELRCRDIMRKYSIGDDEIGEEWKKVNEGDEKRKRIEWKRRYGRWRACTGYWDKIIQVQTYRYI